ncbi:unnamed protein product [Caenorhabditis nigoni]
MDCSTFSGNEMIPHPNYEDVDGSFEDHFKDRQNSNQCDRRRVVLLDVQKAETFKNLSTASTAISRMGRIRIKTTGVAGRSCLASGM